MLNAAAATAAKSLQSCPTLCDPRDGSPPGSPVPGILQARTWTGLPFPSPMHESEKGKWSCWVMSDSERPHGLQPTRLLHPWDSPGKSTGVWCHFLLQEIFPTQELNLGLLHCRQMLYHLSHQGSNHSISASSALLVVAYTWITVVLNDLPWKWTGIILSFLRLHPSTAFWMLCWLWGLLHFF